MRTLLYGHGLIDEAQLLIAESKRREKYRPRSPMFAVGVSEDHGNRWRTVAICETCFDSIEPPMRAKKKGGTGARYCEWCGMINEDTDSQKQGQPIFTARFDNEGEMAQLKEIFSADKITEAFTDADGNYDRDKGQSIITTKAEIAMAFRSDENTDQHS